MHQVLENTALSHNEAKAERWPAYRFNLQEFSGALGDMGTFLPLAVAMSIFCGMDLAVVFVFAGLMNVFTGLYFKQPIPVQPMKAIAAVAIAEGLSAGEIASAGMLMGAFLLVLTLSGSVDLIAKKIPKPIVRGIQLGVGLKLAMKGFAWMWPLSIWQLDGWVTAGIAAALIILVRSKRFPMLMVVFAGGVVIAFLNHGNLFASYAWQWPKFDMMLPTGEQWWSGLTRGALPQLPLTLLNSVVAVCALSGDYFPGRGIKPGRMGMSVSLMNLVAVPFGGMPMCHGSGGLAAQYRFGARTGGSVIMLGVLKVVVAVALGTSLAVIIQSYPVSILAMSLVFAGLMLARAAKDCLVGRKLLLVLITAITIIMYGTMWGFLIGLGIYVLDRWLLGWDGVKDE
ncbi:putative sulfate/molybdate transporter [Poriferisphaera sp. WC338]|uniref:putative sulfate/molybdate transporter n=1 Tax=Poriferisphaera sp. WC338 TaxID=3425129 RepID=UPI003D8134D8